MTSLKITAREEEEVQKSSHEALRHRMRRGLLQSDIPGQQALSGGGCTLVGVEKYHLHCHGYPETRV